MKVTMKMADIEIEIDDPDEKDRSRLLGDGLGCIESMLQSRVSLYGVSPEDEEEEDCISPGKMPGETDNKIRPVIALQGLYG